MNRVLLYGATGYLGRLIATDAARRRAAGEWSGPLVLASRDAVALRRLAAPLNLPWRAFALDDRAPVMDALADIDVVLNAAGPFALTASRLAKAALDAHCHYVDVAGEVDVYKALDDLGPIAQRRELALVSGAGWMAAAADALFAHALDRIEQRGPRDVPLATLRVTWPHSPLHSRGSAATALRAMREHVGVVRRGRLAHVPVGRLERRVNFAAGEARTASAVDALATLVLNRTAAQRGHATLDIESYVAMNGALRLGYELGALGAAAFNLPFAQRAIARPLAVLPEGPSPAARANARETIVLTIEDAWHRTRADWLLDTPNRWDYSARSALDIAIRAARESDIAGGWLTPSALLDRPFAGCTLTDRCRDG